MGKLAQGAYRVIVVLAFLVLLTPPGTVHAQSSSRDPICRPIQDARTSAPVPVTLECSFFSEKDTIYIYPQHGQQEIDSSERDLDYHNSAWLFDTQTDGTVQLIIQFQQTGDQVVADLYDDQTGDGHVDYEEAGGVIQVLESPHPTVRVIAEQDWWTKEGYVNYNLMVLVDGGLWSAFGQSVYQDYLSNDGTIDTRIEVFDTDFDGRPDLEVRHLRELAQEQAELARYSGKAAHVMVNWQDGEAPISDSILWPYLGSEGNPLKAYYHDSRAPIQVSWESGQIAAVGEFVASRGGEHNCFIYSGISLETNQVNRANFENPFCFYDLAGDEDGVPELQIRMEYWPARSEEILDGGLSHPIEWIRYSWRIDAERDWDYGIGLAGRHPITGTVQLGPYEVQSVEYGEYPYWVTQTPWDAVTFVSMEDTYSPTSEGVYAAQVPREVILYYLTGLSAYQPEISLEEITPPGTRLEQNFTFGSQPRLYFSLVDSKLHLVKAAQGLWKPHVGETVRYQDLDGDGYFDYWLYSREQQPYRELYLQGQYSILNELSDETILLKEVAQPMVAFEVIPPRDRTEWSDLRHRLDTYQRDSLPGDFGAILSQLQGASTRIEGVSLRDYRVTSDGFRFILDLHPGFRILSDPNGLGAYLFAPGSYLLACDGHQLTVQPSTPAVLHASQIDSDDRILELEWTSIDVVLENDGLEDLHDVSVYAILAGPRGQQVLTATLASLLAEDSQQVSWDWAPPAAGTWQVRIETDREIGSGGGAEHEVLVIADLWVYPRSSPAVGWFVSLAGRIPAAILALLIVTALLAGGAGAWWAVALRSGRRP